jgi:ubiquinone/menaquinone biosynthesis C-methylase UbiE
MQMNANQVSKHEVADFWDDNPCGSFASTEPRGEKRFYEDVAKFRYAVQPFMRPLIGFHTYPGKRVLEVGCGLGTDLLQFSLAGSSVVGVDLSANSVALASKHLNVFGAQGSLLASDAEHLPFADESFDVVYSFGVLHHTPNTSSAIDECWRVLKPGGRFILMLYNRNSWQVAIEPYVLAVKRRLLRQTLPNRVTDKAEVVRRYDGVENPLGKAYTPAEMREMLRRFVDVRLRIRHPLIVNGALIGRIYSRFLELSGINRRWGFWIMAEGERPAQTV